MRGLTFARVAAHVNRRGNGLPADARRVTLMVEVPCPEEIVPAETVQLKVGVTP